MIRLLEGVAQNVNPKCVKASIFQGIFPSDADIGHTGIRMGICVDQNFPSHSDWVFVPGDRVRREVGRRIAPRHRSNVDCARDKNTARTRQGLAGTDFRLGMWLERGFGFDLLFRGLPIFYFPYLLQLSVYS